MDAVTIARLLLLQLPWPLPSPLPFLWLFVLLSPLLMLLLLLLQLNLLQLLMLLLLFMLLFFFRLRTTAITHRSALRFAPARLRNTAQLRGNREAAVAIHPAYPSRRVNISLMDTYAAMTHWHTRGTKLWSQRAAAARRSDNPQVHWTALRTSRGTQPSLHSAGFVAASGRVAKTYCLCGKRSPGSAAASVSR